jgi:hypothetical protein
MRFLKLAGLTLCAISLSSFMIVSADAATTGYHHYHPYHHYHGYHPYHHYHGYHHYHAAKGKTGGRH